MKNFSKFYQTQINEIIFVRKMDYQKLRFENSKIL